MASSNLLPRCVLGCMYSFINIIYTLTSPLTSFFKMNFLCNIVDLQCYAYFCCTAKRAVMYRYESLTIKKAECWRIDAFELWCWRRLLKVPWTARWQNQSILKEINPEYSSKDWCWSWSSNTLATWCEELTHWKRPWCWARLKAGGEGDDRDGWMASLTQWTWVWVNSSYWRSTGRSGALQSTGVEKSQIQPRTFM